MVEEMETVLDVLDCAGFLAGRWAAVMNGVEDTYLP